MSTQTNTDEAAIRQVIREVYKAISGPAGPRDWEQYARCFVPEGRMVVAHRQPDGSVELQPLSVEEYRRTREPYFSANAFYEIETRCDVTIEGSIALAFSYYESRHDLNQPPFETGVNCLQFARTRDGWRIVQTMWEAGQIGSRLR